MSIWNRVRTADWTKSGATKAVVLLIALAGFQSAWAGLAASVTLAPSALTNIYPGEVTTLRITLSNSNTTNPITAVGFFNSLPGTLPNGLKVAGTPNYSCANASGSVATTGSVDTTVGLQSIVLSGGSIPARSGSTDGSCVIDIPVTAGTDSGGTATYLYAINSFAVTGNDGGAVSNSGAVSQSINVSAFAKPTIAKNFGSSTLTLGGAATALTITITNPNPVAMTGIGLTDVFPSTIKVAATPTATATCSGSGAVNPTFSPAVLAGATSLSVTGGTIAANGSCTIAVAVDAANTGGQYSLTQSNVIDASTQFFNDVGIPAAADATRSVTVRSPLAVSKTGPLSLAAGEAGTFVITLTNNGPNALPASFTDSPIDAITGGIFGLTATSAATTCGGSAALAGGSEGVSLSGGTIPANGSCTVTIGFIGTLQTANTPQAFTNSLSQGVIDVGNPAIVSQATSATVTIYDTFSISKAAPVPTNAAPGSPVKYQVTVQNWSATDMANVTIADTLASGQTFLTGTIGSINYTPTVTCTSGSPTISTSSALGDGAANLTVSTVPQRSSATSPGSCTATFWAMTATSAVSGNAYTNQLGVGSVCYNPGSGNVCNGGASNTVIGTVASVISVAKSFSPAGPLNEGAITRMTISMSNLSVNALTSVAISDNLPLAAAGGGQMRVASPANAATTCGGSPVITAVAGSTSVQMNGATIPARASGGTGAAGTCNLQVDVIAPAGVYTNTASVTGSQTYANGTVANNVGPVTANVGITFNSSLCSASSPCSKGFNPASVASGGKSTVTIRLVNSGALALTGVALTDPLPTGMVLASPANPYTTCSGSTSITAVAGASTISLAGATIAGASTCDLVFDVIATGSANWTNTLPAGNITANGGVSNQTAVTGTLTYSPPNSMTVAKATNPSTLTFPGQVSQLTITVNNGSVAVSNLSLTDYFTADGTAGAAANGMVVAPTPTASTTCPSGVVTAVPGAASVSLSGASLAANASCTLTVNVTSTAVGGITNFIPANAIVTNQGLSNSGQATTSLTTQSNVGIAKQFTPNVVKPGERSRLRITVYNPTAQPVTNLSVTDNLPAGVTVPAGANPTTTCTGATVSAPTTSSVQITGASIAAASGGVSASCFAEIDVLVSAAGDYVNTIPVSAISAVIGGTPVTNSQPASDTLRAKAPLVIHKAFSAKTLDAGNPAGFTTGSDSKSPGAPATLTIRLDNPNAQALTAASFTDTLPTNLVVATTPNANTTCASSVVTASASSTTVRLTGATVPANGSCLVTVDVLSNISGNYVNTLPSGSVTTFEGVSNEDPTRAELIISTPPTVAKQFTPAVIPPNGVARLRIEIGNANASALILSSVFTDTLPTAPGNIVVAPTPNIATTCGSGVGSITAPAGSGSVSLASGSTVPAAGCYIEVDLTGATPGDYTNNIPAGALVTNLGNNQQPANAPLAISTLGYVSGRVFADNNVTPNGTYESGTDTPLGGVSIELRNGADCSGALVSQVGLTNPFSTDALGNYLFSGLAAGTYSVCQPAQPTGTTNGTSVAGSITSVSGSTGTAGAASNPTATSSQIASIVLGAGSGSSVSGSPNNNFAEVIPSSLSGTVFLDQNNNGTQNGADAGISGVSIELLNSSGTVIATTTTDASGNYSFTGLAPGSYSVREPVQPAGTSSGITSAGTVANGGTPGTVTAVTTLPSTIGTTTKIVLPPNTASSANNFAEIPNGRTLSGRVFVDYDNSGTPNGSDYGLPNQTINLTGTDVNGNPVTRTTTTGSDGRYSFANLPESNGSGYTVTQPAQPSGTTNGTTTAGSAGGTATGTGTAPSVISVINLAGSNIVSADNNFAEVPGPAPDLAIVKTHSPSSFAAGSSTGYYTITPSNVGSVATSGVITVVDTLPAGITVAQTPSGIGWSCLGAIGAGAFTCTSSSVIGAASTGQPITARVAVAAGLEGQILTNSAVISGGGEPAGLTGNNTATVPVAVATTAAVTGRVWLDKDHDRAYVAGINDVGQAGWTVELLLSGVLVGSTTSAADGTYILSSLAPGSGYQIRFRHPVTGLIWGRAVPNESGTSFTSGTNSGTTAVGTGIRSGANPAGAVVTDGTLSNLTFTSGTTTIEQSLPIDPAGVVYDAITRQPVAGAVVTVSGPAGFNPVTDLVGGQASFTTGADGLYQFLLNPSAPAGDYQLAVTTYPGGYSTLPSALIPVCTNTLTVGAAPAPALVQTSDAAPTTASTLHAPSACPSNTSGFNATNQGSTQYYAVFNLSSGSANVLNNHIPLDPLSGNGFVISKTGDKRLVEVGDTVRYTVEVRLISSGLLPQVTVRDRLPAGFTLVRGTVQINGVPAADPSGGLGPVLGFNLGQLRGSTNATGTAPQVIKLQYRVRVGVGAMQGGGINTAQAHGCSVTAGCLNAALLPIANSVQSNAAQYKVQVTGGVFTTDACLLGKVFVDCNNNHIQDPEELGIPGVRLYFSDGHFVVTDVEGKYSRCGITPRSHVLTADPSTLPTGSRLTTSSNRNLGDADSLFLDLKNGELHRGDFVEGSCANQVLEQVKARRSQGEVRSVETERPAGPALRFRSKPPAYPQQGTDSASQPLVTPRTGASDAR